MRRRHVPGEPAPPSKGELKRRAQAAQELGEQLVDAPDALLDGLQLPEKLLDAIREAKRITSHSALLRQRLFIGKLLRQLDHSPIRAALDARERARSVDVKALRRVEAWRDRLLQDGEPALAALLAECPAADPRTLARLLAGARSEMATGAPPRARRQLFRTLREALEGPSPAPQPQPDARGPHGRMTR